MAVQEDRQLVRAQAKWVRTSARKARLVTDHIRGRSVPEARTVLAFTQRAAARDVEKVLRSAVANAEANHGLLGDDLVVHAATVDEGPTVKRWRARARGRVNRIFKRTCHITVVLTPGETKVAERPKRSRAKAPAAATPAAPAAEEKPKPKRTRAKKAEPEATTTEKPKPKRTRAKKTQEEAAE